MLFVVCCFTLSTSISNNSSVCPRMHVLLSRACFGDTPGSAPALYLPAVELQTRVRTKVRNHGEGPYIIALPTVRILWCIVRRGSGAH